MDVWNIDFINLLKYGIDTIAKVVIPVEALILVVLHRHLFFGDVLVNVLVGSFIGLFMWLGYWNVPWQVLGAIYEAAPWHLEITPAVFIAHVLAGDLCFYCFHRLAHTRVFFLLDHNVHHSSSDLNFSTNLRISLVSIFYAWTPLMVPVFLGFQPALLIACFALANAVPFFMHNQYVGKLGWLEHIFNTPSHHRVHHGMNPCYINKNYAGIFIIWDKLFGTYAEEIEPVKYGAAGMVAYRNPFKIVSQGWFILARPLIQKFKRKPEVV